MLKFILTIGRVLAFILALVAITAFVSQVPLARIFLGIGFLWSIIGIYLLFQRVFCLYPKWRRYILCVWGITWIAGICLIKAPNLPSAISWSEGGISGALFGFSFVILLIILTLYILEKKYFQPDMVKERFIKDSKESGNASSKNWLQRVICSARKRMDAHYIESSSFEAKRRNKKE